jgi:hypothetical protein
VLQVHCGGGCLDESGLRDQLAAVNAINIYAVKQGITQTAVVDDVHACKGMQGKVLSKYHLAGWLIDALQLPLTDDFTDLLRSS